MARRKNRKRKYFSSSEKKAYWMGVGAGEMVRENSDKPLMLPSWKIKDLGPKAVESYYKGVKKNYRSFD